MTKALTSAQESRLVNYLDDALLQLSRAFETRRNPHATLPTLGSYLDVVKKLQGLVLDIPPVGTSASLRVAYQLTLLSLLAPALSSYPLPENLTNLWTTLRYFDTCTSLVLTGHPSPTSTASTKQGEGAGPTEKVRLISIVNEIREELSFATGVPLSHSQPRTRVNIRDEVQEPHIRFPSGLPDTGTEEVATPSLMEDDGEMSVDTASVQETEQEGSEEDEAFEEVQVVSPDQEEGFSVHFSPPPPAPSLPPPPAIEREPEQSFDDLDSEREEDDAINEGLQGVFAETLRNLS